MPQSTTIINAKVLSISADGTDICGTTMSMEATVERAVAEFFTACGDWARNLTGKRKWSGTVTIFFSETADEGFDVLAEAFENDTEVSLIFSPAGGNPGNQQWTGTVLLTSLPLSLNPGDAAPITIAFPFVGQGELARAAVT